jgi:hypothetical protein
MARLNNYKQKTFANKDFEQYPIWVWDDEMEYKMPITEQDPCIQDYSGFFIKSSFKNSYCDFLLNGYLAGNGNYYAFGLFYEEETIGFNINTPALNKQSLVRLFSLIQCEPFPLFPLHYQSPVRFKGGDPIQGILDYRTPQEKMTKQC